MPYMMRKVKNKSCYKVYNIKSKKVFAKCTRKKKAKNQLRLLRAIKYDKTFRNKIKNTKVI